jgi:cyanate permease
MLAVMHDAGAELAGRASGKVMFGFLIGLGIAPPVYGRTVDVTGSYTLMWWMAVVAYTAAFLLVVAWSRSVAATRRANVA